MSENATQESARAQEMAMLEQAIAKEKEKQKLKEQQVTDTLNFLIHFSLIYS